MRKAGFGLLLTALILASAYHLMAQGGTYGKYLTVADVEKATGLTGVTVTETDNQLKFKLKQTILQVQFQGQKVYKLNKETPGYVKAEISGVGEEAFIGPVVNLPYVLIFRQKDYCVRLTDYMDSDGKFVLTMDQLIALGKIIASRI